MRILGAILLIAGFFLCLTILWAAIGFLAMGLGLICLLIAERRQEQLKKRTPSQLPGLQREAAQAIPEEEVASNAVPPELPKTEPHPLYPGGSVGPMLSRRSSIQSEDCHAAEPMVTARSYGAEGRRLIAMDDADIPQLVNVTKPSSRTGYAGPLAVAAPPATTSPDAGREAPDASRETVDPGDRLGRAASRRQSHISNRRPASPAPKAAATTAIASREVRPNSLEAQAAGHSADAGFRRAGVQEGAGAVTSAKGESAPRRPATDAEDVRNLAELLSNIARDLPGAERR
jgi:hypothetical protein